MNSRLKAIRERVENPLMLEPAIRKDLSYLLDLLDEALLRLKNISEHEVEDIACAHYLQEIADDIIKKIEGER
jgi:hypothetical protein